MDIIKRSIIGLFFGWVIFYLIYLLSNWIIIVNADFLEKNNLILGVYLLIFAYYFIFYSIKPIYINKYRLRNTLLWLLIITSSWSLLLNSWQEWLYFGDIFIIIWIILTIIWPTKILVSNKIKKEKQEKKMEIIEA